MPLAPVASQDLAALIANLPNQPDRLLIDVWNWCNFECAHCCQESSPREARRTWTVEAFADAIEQAAALGVPRVTLIGGEPTMHPEVLTFVRLASRAGLSVGLVSNGWSIDDAFAEALAAHGCAEVALSVYGHTPSMHEAVTRHGGSFQRLRNAAAALARAEIATRIIVVVTALSVRALQTYEFWRTIGDLAPRSVRVVNFQPVGRGETFRSDLQVPPADYVQTLRELQTWTFPWRVTMSRFYFGEGETSKAACADQFGRSPALMSDRSVRPCCTLSADPLSTWSIEEIHTQAASAACRHLPPAAAGWEIRCPLVEVEMRRGPALVAGKA